MVRKWIPLPKRYPVGTKYVIEGTNSDGVFHVTRRFVLLPSGRMVDLPTQARSLCNLPDAPSIVPTSSQHVHRAGRKRSPLRA